MTLINELRTTTGKSNYGFRDVDMNHFTIYFICYVVHFVVCAPFGVCVEAKWVCNFIWLSTGSDWVQNGVHGNDY
jgi:hypothetical protein